MGDPRKAHKKYKRPKKIHLRTRIDEDQAISKNYGLKNMRELWRTETEITRIRDQAKKLIINPANQETFFNRLKKLGLIKGDVTIDDVLALTKEKLLDRRLQTIVYKKGLAKTVKGARQFITHRKIKIQDRIVDVPGYLVKIDEENKISLVQKKQKEKKAETEKISLEKMEEIKEIVEKK